jgi:uncharacterized protein (TIGR04255 family)
MAMEKFVPEIQERLRHSGFPRFVKGQLQELILQADGPPRVNAVDRFEFLNRDNSVGVLLSPSSLIIQTTKYRNFEDFEKSVATALRVVNSIVKIDLAERIGLRYVDVVRLQDRQTFADYLRPGLLGIDTTELGITANTSRYEFLGVTPMGKLLIRSAQSENPLPINVVPSSMSLSVPLKPNEVAAVLDFDHFVEESAEFDVDQILSTLQDLHDGINRAFRNAVTSQALTFWGNEEN